jgi:hypothetical protein
MISSIGKGETTMEKYERIEAFVQVLSANGVKILSYELD